MTSYAEYRAQRLATAPDDDPQLRDLARVFGEEVRAGRNPYRAARHGTDCDWLLAADMAMESAPLYFMHMPKCAGHSFAKAIAGAVGPRRFVLAGVPSVNVTGRSEAAHIPDDAVIFGAFAWGYHNRQRAWPRYATVLRDPIERAASMHRHVQTLPAVLDQPAASPIWRARSMSLAAIADAGEPLIANRMTAMLAGQRTATNADREALELAKLRLLALAWLGLLDDDGGRILGDLDALGDTVGAKIILPHLNRTVPAKISAADRAAVAAVNALDIELWQFANSLVW